MFQCGASLRKSWLFAERSHRSFLDQTNEGPAFQTRTQNPPIIKGRVHTSAVGSIWMSGAGITGGYSNILTFCSNVLTSISWAFPSDLTSFSHWPRSRKGEIQARYELHSFQQQCSGLPGHQPLSDLTPRPFFLVGNQAGLSHYNLVLPFWWFFCALPRCLLRDVF